MNYLLGLIISSTLGFLLINLWTVKKPIDFLQKIALSIAIGLGLSGQIGFYSLIVNNAYSPLFVGGASAALLTALILRNVWLYRQEKKSFGKDFKAGLSLKRDALIGLAALSLLLIPLWREAHFFPFGGWDAWSCWNLKARFIFLGGENWKNMLAPELWRSNNHYPFLLPLINAWGWTFYNDANVLVPMFNAIVFSFLTALFMFASLSRLTGQRFTFVPALVLFSLPFVNKLSISQYSDIVVAFYLLAALSSLLHAKTDNHIAWAVVSGLCVGLMSFTKTEGLVASVIVAAAAFFLLRGQSKLLTAFAVAAAVSFLPAIIFKFAFSPENVAFTNGLTSTQAHTNLFRLQAILMFLGVEFISDKWNGLWVLLFCGLAIAGRKSLSQDRWIVPAVILAFLAIALAYYYINTYFEILWWLKVTLNRILYIILPVLVWWVFYSLWAPSSTKK